MCRYAGQGYELAASCEEMVARWREANSRMADLIGSGQPPDTTS
jgi:hypothetical protein